MIYLLLAGGGVFFYLLTRPATVTAKVPTPAQDDGLSGLAQAGIVGSVIAGAIAAIKAFRSTAHLRADEWVQGVQNPYGRALAAVVDEKDRKIADKTATKAFLVLSKKAVVELWTEYRRSAEEWAKKGKEYALVINQSYDTLTPLMTQILADYDRQYSETP